MPREQDARKALDLDDGYFHPPVWGRLLMPRQPVVLQEDERFKIVVDEDGITKKVLKDSMSMPMFLDHPIKGRKDWEEIKANLNMTFPDRIPKDWEQVIAPLKNDDRAFPVSLLGYPEGLFGHLRDLLGVDYLLTAVYDEPMMIHEILDTLTDLWICLWEEQVAQFEVDGVTFWEDMCFRNGPLISPKMFKEFLLPQYKRLTEAGRAMGIRHYLVDTDRWRACHSSYGIDAPCRTLV